MSNLSNLLGIPYTGFCMDLRKSKFLSISIIVALLNKTKSKLLSTLLEEYPILMTLYHSPSFLKEVCDKVKAKSTITRNQLILVIASQLEQLKTKISDNVPDEFKIILERVQSLNTSAAKKYLKNIVEEYRELDVLGGRLRRRKPLLDTIYVALKLDTTHSDERILIMKARKHYFKKHLASGLFIADENLREKLFRVIADLYGGDHQVIRLEWDQLMTAIGSGQLADNEASTIVGLP